MVLRCLKHPGDEWKDSRHPFFRITPPVQITCFFPFPPLPPPSNDFTSPPFFIRPRHYAGPHQTHNGVHLDKISRVQKPNHQKRLPFRNLSLLGRSGFSDRASFAPPFLRGAANFGSRLLLPGISTLFSKHRAFLCQILHAAEFLGSRSTRNPAENCTPYCVIKAEGTLHIEKRAFC